MIALLALAAQMMDVAPPPARDTVPVTQFGCSMQTTDGKAFRIAGITPLFKPGRDVNRQETMAMNADAFDALKGMVGANVLHASEQFRDFQISTARGNESYTLTVKLRRGSQGVAWLTRYAPATPPEPYRYVAVGLCTADFDAKAAA
jgi:hypothetical protein